MTAFSRDNVNFVSSSTLSAFRILSTIPHPFPHFSIPHFTFRIPQFRILPTTYNSLCVNIQRQVNKVAVQYLNFLKRKWAATAILTVSTDWLIAMTLAVNVQLLSIM